MGLYDDEFDGVGGSYLVDPNTGRRVRTEAPTLDHPDGNRAREADEAQASAPAAVSTAPAAEQDTREGESEAGTPAGAGPNAAPPVEDHQDAPAAPHADV